MSAYEIRKAREERKKNPPQMPSPAGWVERARKDREYDKRKPNPSEYNGPF